MSSELILPEARNEYSLAVVDAVDRILTILPGSVVARQQFATSIVVAANELKPGSCTKSSVLLSAFHAARIGLTPGSALGLCYFIPRKRRKTDTYASCQLEIGYRGFLDLSYSNKFLRNVHAEVVLEGEEFRYWVDSDGPQILHDIPDCLSRDVSPGSIRNVLRGCYCIYHTRDGGRGLRWLTRAQLNEIDSKSNVWASHYLEMCRKSAIRRAAKDWKVTPEMAMAITLDEQGERGDRQDIGFTPPVDPDGNSEILDLDELE